MKTKNFNVGQSEKLSDQEPPPSTRQLLLNAISSAPAQTIGRLARDFGVHYRTVEYHMRRLEGTGQVIFEKESQHRYWFANIAPWDCTIARKIRLLLMTPGGKDLIVSWIITGQSSMDLPVNAASYSSKIIRRLQSLEAATATMGHKSRPKELIINALADISNSRELQFN